MRLLDFKTMYELEKSHWWFAAKSEYVKFFLEKNRKKLLKILDGDCNTFVKATK